MTEIPPVAVTCPNFWSFLEKLYDKNGLSAIVLLLMGYAFYQLIWKVWSAAMKGKDDEIQRLSENRNKDRSRSTCQKPEAGTV